MTRNFDDWLKEFKCSISRYKYYIDFEKVYWNVDNIKSKLNILNSLIGGHQMKDLIEGYIKKSGVKEYYKEMYLIDIEKKWNVDLSAISANGILTRRFDFVVKTDIG